MNQCTHVSSCSCMMFMRACRRSWSSIRTSVWLSAHSVQQSVEVLNAVLVSHIPRSRPPPLWSSLPRECTRQVSAALQRLWSQDMVLELPAAFWRLSRPQTPPPCEEAMARKRGGEVREGEVGTEGYRGQLFVLFSLSPFFFSFSPETVG